MTQLNLKNVIHKESDKVNTTTRYYFKIYTENRIFNVYQDFQLKSSWGGLYNHIKNHKSFKFLTANDISIYIDTDAIIAMEISKHAFPKGV